MPHHGSKTSSSDTLLDAVRPRWALIQAGYRNRFGHPAPAVLTRYQAHGIAVLTSAECGAWRWHSEAEAGECQRVQNRRYWHWVPEPKLGLHGPWPEVLEKSEEPDLPSLP